MKEMLFSPFNAPSLEPRIMNSDSCVIYLNDFYWVVDIDGYYEFYYNPNHFIAKIAKEQMPQSTLEFIKQQCKAFPKSSIQCLPTSAPLHSSSIILDEDFEKTFNRGNWFHSPGCNCATFNNRFVYSTDMSSATECSLNDVDGGLVYEMLRMSAQSRTPSFFRGLINFPFFEGVDLSGVDILPFWGAKWDSHECFLDICDQCSSNDLSVSTRRCLRASVFLHTVYTTKIGSYCTESGKTVSLPSDSQLIAQSRLYSKQMDVCSIPEQPDPTIIQVENIDCLHAARKIQQMGYNPAVLNMASGQNPGGGVLNGAGAQEENLFRRTNLHRSMFQFAHYAKQYGLPLSSDQYPLEENFGGVYSPNVVVFRETESEGYTLLEETFETSFISVAGLKRPELDSDGLIIPELIETEKNKIRTIFRIGLMHGHDSLILGAIGCGAYRNPPRQIAKIFHEIIEESEFKNKFRMIFFAILEDHNSKLAHNPEGNFLPFFEEFIG